MGELAKPIDTLIREVSKGVSKGTEGSLRRWNEKRDLIHAMNMCKIIEKAQITCKQQNGTSLNVENGFLLNFLDKCKTVSDPNMQDLWARVLAKESDTPDSFSQLAINSLEDFGKRDAESFISLCGFVCKVNTEEIPFIEDVNDDIYTKNGINSNILEHLCALNVIEIHSIWENKLPTKTFIPRVKPGDSISLFYFDKRLNYVNNGENNASMNTGQITFTSIGKEIFSICDYKQVDGFFEYLKHKWRWSINFGHQWMVDEKNIVITKQDLRI